jgi:flavin-dependent thymidylate synthase
MIFTKGTRLNMDADRFAAIQAMSEQEKYDELAYMARTIPSSWEFVHFTFLISNVTRATAQQITRTRQASYAMQSQRVADLTGVEVTNPFYPHSDEWDEFDEAKTRATNAYENLTAMGAEKEDARGILPMNSQCNLVASYNLRTLTELLSKRKSLRAQGEYREIARAMESAILGVFPWASPFFEDKHALAIQMLEAAAEEIGVTVGSGPGWQIAKAIDLIRGKA